MNSAMKRLEAASTGLTARERAILVLRPWLAGGELDERLHAPPVRAAERVRRDLPLVCGVRMFAEEDVEPLPAALA